MALGEQVVGIKVSVKRYVSDDPQPGIVECELIDANGESHLFIEKTSIVSEDDLDAHSSYPLPGLIACTILDRRHDEIGTDLICIDIEKPYSIESIEGKTRFVVLPDQIRDVD